MVKAKEPTLRAATESVFVNADPAGLDSIAGHAKGHGRIEERTVSVVREADWLDGDRRFPGEPRLPAAASIIRVKSRTKLSSPLPSRPATPSRRRRPPPPPELVEGAAAAVRGHWGIENRRNWVLDVVFREDQSRLRKGHGAKNMAVVRHFAINLIGSAKDKRSIKLRRKIAGWDQNYLAELLNSPPRYLGFVAL